MKNSTPYLKYTNAELDAALWEIVLHTRKLEALVRDVIQYSGPDDPGVAGSPPVDAGPVQTTDPLALDNRAAAPVSAGSVILLPHGPRGLEEAGTPITCPASSPVCRFGQGEYQRGWDGGPIL